jgi:hypothetical protein
MYIRIYMYITFPKMYFIIHCYLNKDSVFAEIKQAGLRIDLQEQIISFCQEILKMKSYFERLATRILKDNNN